MKLVPQSEIERAKSDVNERLQKMKEVLQRVGVGGELLHSSDDSKGKVQDSKSYGKPQASLAKSIEGTRSAESFCDSIGSATSSRTILTSESLPAVPIRVAEKDSAEYASTQSSVSSVGSSAQVAHSSKTSRVRKFCADAGTDPIDSLMGSNSFERLATPTPSRRLGHEIETQTTLPPAPVNMLTSTSKVPEAQVSQLQHVSSTEGIRTEPEPQIDGDLIEKEMKEFLMGYVTKSADRSYDNNNVEIVEIVDGGGDYGGENQEGSEAHRLGGKIESPRIEPIKVAEQRQPPNPRSRQGYRSFRMPTSRPNSSKAS